MVKTETDDRSALEAARHAIQEGDVATLTRLLAEHPTLATQRIGPRTLLHVATDWPGHFPDAAASVRALVTAGSDVNAPFIGTHSETPLHWAASSNDLAALDALLDAGAHIEAPGAVIGGGTPLADAVAFGQWDAARRLVERGARATLWQAAALGLLSRVDECLAEQPPPDAAEITKALWCACHGGQRDAAECLLARGADVNWVGYDELRPLDAAVRSGANHLLPWLLSVGARHAKEPV
jgi:hypothetical protein